MPLSREEVEHIAKLARLDLTPEQQARYREQLSQILDFVAKLSELDTTAVPPTAGGGLKQMRFRLDESHPGLPVESLLQNAAETEDHQFKIPPVFE
jgi:aspartyl-tRNA(Asn)/glutamyl-tRNA(Gln) amidotransferase subunit C